MSEINKLLKDEIEDFRAFGHKFINKEINRNEFKGKSGAMGVYAQRGEGKFMIRLRTPSGIISHKNINLINSYAKKYNLDCIHLTTRQAVQLHELTIDNVCDIMDDAIDNSLYTRGAGGNFPRNVALSPLSGVEKGEAFDVTPFSLLVGDYLMSQITKYHLPRKLKVSFSSSNKDSGKATLNDLGFLAVIENGKPYFKVYLAGGLGPNPSMSVPFDELVVPEDVLYHVEAVVRLFMAEGDYNNKSKARMRYIPKRMGEEEFINCYKRHLNEVKSSIDLKEITPSIDIGEARISEESTGLSIKNDNCVISQKQSNKYTVVIHPICGQLLKEDLDKIVKFINKVPHAEIRLSMEENMYVRNLSEKEARELLDITSHMRQKTKVDQSVSCIGVPTCQLGIEKSQELLKAILKALAENDVTKKYLPSIHVSGCMNSCSRHQVSEIGFAGTRKRVNDVVEDVFELHVGGKFSREESRVGKILGQILEREIPSFICELGNKLDKVNMSFNDYLINKEEEFLSITKKYILD